MKQKPLVIIGCVILALVLFVIINLVIVKYNGKNVPVPEIPRGPQQLGSGQPLSYVIMGDSSVVSQGSEYEDGYALASAQHLAKRYRVTFVNTGVSGAVAKDVADKQLPEAMKHKPDVVVIAVGANDVTHFTSAGVIDSSIQKAVDGLKEANPNVKIIVTGSAAMDAVDRFTWPVKQLAYIRVKSINNTFNHLVERNNLTWAPVALETRDAFKKDPSLFAPDKFHPNARGYQLWKPVINRALDQALASPAQQ